MPVDELRPEGLATIPHGGNHCPVPKEKESVEFGDFAVFEKCTIKIGSTVV
jgi:hypothetical protein